MKLSLRCVTEKPWRAPIAHRAASVLLAGLLSACAAAPGFRMPRTVDASIASTSGYAPVEATSSVKSTKKARKKKPAINADAAATASASSDATATAPAPADAPANPVATAYAVAQTTAVAQASADAKPVIGPHIPADQTTPDIPVTELTLGVVRQMADDSKSQLDHDVKALFGAPESYVTGPGDVLQIVVWDHPELAAALGTAGNQPSQKAGDPASGFVVDQNGNLHFPYAGTLRVAGLRTDQIRDRLSAALSKYLVNPQVTVRMASYRSREVYVDGEVRSPGALSLTDVPLSFYDAIARAGGFNDTADQSDVSLVRGSQSFKLDLPRMLAQGFSPSKLYLKTGDLLRVTSRSENDVYVMGEVNKPGSAIPRQSGRISLADAISQAGSINSNTADTAQMFVIRSADDQPRVYHLDSRSPVAMLVAKDFELQPKDIVYVDGNGLVRFNRVLSLLMPLISSGLTAGVIAK